jgi:hypothetical protein
MFLGNRPFAQISPENGSVDLIGVSDPQRWPICLHGDQLTVTGGMAKGTLFAVKFGVTPALQIGPFTLIRKSAPTTVRASGGGGAVRAGGGTGGEMGWDVSRTSTPTSTPNRPSEAPAVAAADKESLMQMLQAARDAAHVDAVELTFQMDGVTCVDCVCAVLFFLLH